MEFNMLLDKFFYASLAIFNFSFIVLVGFFIWGAFLTERIRKIVFRIGREEIDSLDVEALIRLLEKHEIPLRFYAKDLVRSAHGLVEINGDKLDLDLKQRLHRSILRRGIVV